MQILEKTQRIGYEFHKLSRRRFKLLCRYLFQIDLADKVNVTSTEPFVLTNLPCKIVGVVIDIDNFTVDLDCEEII